MIGKLGSLTDELRMLQGGNPLSPKKNGEMETPEKGKVSFGDFLSKSFNEMNEMGLDVDRKIQSVVEGKAANPHETMIAIQEADVSFRLMLNVKDQLEQAFQTIMRTSVG